MKIRNRNFVWLGKRVTKTLVMSLGIAFWMSGCSRELPHHGRIPFRWMESPPCSKQPERLQRLENNQDLVSRFQPGDVIAFSMSHQEAMSYLKKGVIQKVPYDWFRYGHIALVVPGKKAGELRLLQVAMRQAVNMDYGLEYLQDKHWNVYRPPHGSVDPGKLREFSRLACEACSDPKKAYDYAGALGIRNAPWLPETADQLGHRYSCATLVVAGLHYAGFHLEAVHRGGWLDVVTPSQVVESQGKRLNR